MTEISINGTGLPEHCDPDSAPGSALPKREVVNVWGCYLPHATAADASEAVAALTRIVEVNPGRSFRIWLDVAIPAGLPPDFHSFAQAARANYFGPIPDFQKAMLKAPPATMKSKLEAIFSRSRPLQSQADAEYFSRPPQLDIKSTEAPRPLSANDYPEYDRQLTLELHALKERGVPLLVTSEHPPVEGYLLFLGSQASRGFSLDLASRGGISAAIEATITSAEALARSTVIRDRDLATKIVTSCNLDSNEVPFIIRGCDHQPSMQSSFSALGKRMGVCASRRVDWPTDCLQDLMLQKQLRLAHPADSKIRVEAARTLIFSVLLSSMVADLEKEPKQATDAVCHDLNDLSNSKLKDWLRIAPEMRAKSLLLLAQGTAQWLADQGKPHSLNLMKG